MNTILFRGGRVIDPVQNLDRVTDVWVHDGVIVGYGDLPGLPEWLRPGQGLV